MAFPILDVAVNAAKPTCVDMVSKLFSLADIKNIVYVFQIGDKTSAELPL